MQLIFCLLNFRGDDRIKNFLCELIRPTEFGGVNVEFSHSVLFPFTENGMRYVIVLVDYLTKYFEAKAIPTSNAPDTVNFFVYDVFLRHGAVEILHSDRGKNFISELAKAVNKSLETNHRTTCAFWPQATALCERQMHTFSDMLSMYVSSDQKNWADLLPFLVFSYNTSRQESTGYTPFYLIFSREAKVPLDIELNVSPEPLTPAAETFTPTTEEKSTTAAEKILTPAAEKALEYVFSLHNRMKLARNIVMTRLAGVQQKAKERYDEGRREVTYEKGDLALVYRPHRKVGNRIN